MSKELYTLRDYAEAIEEQAKKLPMTIHNVVACRTPGWKQTARQNLREIEKLVRVLKKELK